MNNKTEIKEGCVILWHENYWDGFMNGVCNYQNELHWFELKKDYSKLPYRTFSIHIMTEEQKKWKIYWHEQFVKHVGGHTNYRFDEVSKKHSRNHADTDQQYHGDMQYAHEMFYEPKKMWDVSNPELLVCHKNKCVGWTTYGVLIGEPWVEWRRSRKTNVSGQEKDESKVQE